MAIGHFLFQDDMTSCGGVITEGMPDHMHFGRLQACEEHSVTCGKHPGLYKIMGGLPDDFIHGRRIAGTLHSRSTCPCRAEFIPSMYTDTYELNSQDRAENSTKTLNSKNVGRLLAAGGVYNGNIEGFRQIAEQLGGDAPAGYEQVLNEGTKGAAIAAASILGAISKSSTAAEVAQIERLIGGGKRPDNMSPPGAGRSGAFREAKRASGIPVSQHPDRVTPNYDRRGNTQPGVIYEFDVKNTNGNISTVKIRDDSAGHFYGENDPQNRGSHFNDDKGNHYDY